MKDIYIYIYTELFVKFKLKYDSNNKSNISSVHIIIKFQSFLGIKFQIDQ